MRGPPLFACGPATLLLDEQGGLDLPYIAHLAGQPYEQVVEALGDQIYRVPGTSQYELSDVYLSGNVVAKLRDARVWAERNPAFARNVAALEAVQPAPLGPKEIILNLNAFWLPGPVVTAFIKALLPAWAGEAYYSTSLGEWVLSDPGKQGAFAVEAMTRWGTKRADAIDILQASLRGIPITVHDLITVGDREKRVLNPAETVAAQEKQQELAQAFQRWVWDDPERAEQLCALYNDRFNSHRMRVYNGSHLSFPGINTSLLRDGDLAAYQKGAVWQILQRPSTLLGFAIGGGKAFTAIAAAVEARRIGLCMKALAVVPNSLVGQWATEARRLYPDIKVLAMAPEDFVKQRRGIVLSRIATGDWDLVVIAHTSFKLLPLSADLVTTFRDTETDRLTTRCALAADCRHRAHGLSRGREGDCFTDRTSSTAPALASAHDRTTIRRHDRGGSPARNCPSTARRPSSCGGVACSSSVTRGINASSETSRLANGTRYVSARAARRSRGGSTFPFSYCTSVP